MSMPKYMCALAALSSLCSCGVTENKIPGTPGYIAPPSSSTAPTAPSNLQVLVQSDERITVTWSDHSVDELGFELERASIFSGTQSGFAVIGEVGSNITSYTDDSVREERTYVYRVRSFNNGGSSAFTNESQGTTPAAILSYAQ